MTTLAAQRPAPDQAPPPRPPALRRSGRGLAGQVTGQGYGTLSIALGAGSAVEAPGAWGTAQLLVELLDKGTADRSSNAFALAAERLGASFFSSCDHDGAVLGAQAPVGALPAVAELLAEAAWSPALPDDELELARAAALAELARRADEPAALAADAFRRALWSPQSRYTTGTRGTAAAVAAATRDDLLAFRSQRWSAAHATPLVAGDLARVDVDAVLATLVAPDGTADAPETAAQAPVRANRRVLVVHRPGAVQSHLLVGHDVRAVHGPAAVPSMLAGLPVFGLFGSRLNRLLREERGVTYGLGGRFERRRDGGELLVSTAVRGDATAASVDAIVAGLVALHADGLTPQELEEARAAALGGRAMRLRTAQGLHAHLVEVVQQDLPLDVEEQVDAAVRATTAQQVADAARQELRPDGLLVVVVGDADVHVRALEALEIGPVEVVDAA